MWEHPFRGRLVTTTALSFVENNTMPCLLHQSGIDFVMYTRDHPPPHVHIFYSGTEFVFLFHNNLFLRNEPPPKLRKKIIRIINSNREAWIEKFNNFSRNYGSR